MQLLADHGATLVDATDSQASSGASTADKLDKNAKAMRNKVIQPFRVFPYSPPGYPTVDPPPADCSLSGLALLSESGPAAALPETLGETARLLSGPGRTQKAGRSPPALSKSARAA